MHGCEVQQGVRVQSHLVQRGLGSGKPHVSRGPPQCVVGPIFGVFWVDEPQHDASDVQITPDAQDLFDLKVCDEYPDIPCVVSYVNHLAVALNSSIFGGKLLSGVSPLFFC